MRLGRARTERFGSDITRKAWPRWPSTSRVRATAARQLRVRHSSPPARAGWTVVERLAAHENEAGDPIRAARAEHELGAAPSSPTSVTAWRSLDSKPEASG